MLFVHNVQQLRSSLRVRHSFYCLIMASSKLKQYVYARPRFCKHIFKRNINNFSCHFLCLNFQPSKFLNLLLFFTNFNLLVPTVCIYKRVYNFLGSYSGTWFCSKKLQLLRFEAPKWPSIKQLLSTKYCSGLDRPQAQTTEVKTYISAINVFSC